MFLTSVTLHHSLQVGTRKDSYAYIAGPDVDACAGVSLDELTPLTASTGIIKSPGYDENIYPYFANCQWLITAPPGQVRMICNYFNYKSITCI